MPAIHSARGTVRNRATGILLALLAASPALCARTYDFGAVDEAARKIVADGGMPSIAFAIARDGELLHGAAFGLADREAGHEATLHTAYPLASATKPITATALMVLHERDGLALDARLGDVLPEFRLEGNGAGRITLISLLTHASGLGTYARIRYGDDIARAPDSLEDWQRHAVIVNSPGLISEYSNLGYGLLGEVAAAHAGMPFPDVIAQRVFKPLRMDDAFIDTPRAGQSDVAVHYDAAMARLPPLHNNTPGAGNVYASATDLIRFAMLHAGASGEQPLSAASVSSMQARHDDAFHHYYGDAFYGLGWYVRNEGDHRVVWHEGGMPGASTIIKLLPEQRLAVVVLANSTDANAHTQAIANQLLRTVLPEYAAEPLDPVAGYAPMSAHSGFDGTWSGLIRVDGAEVPASLTISAAGAATFRHQPAGQPAQAGTVNAIVNGNSFISALPGRLPSKDIGSGDEPLLLLKLVRTGDTLGGAVVAYSSLARLEYLLPFPIELTRER